MLSYRHVFHAGNHADIIKHISLMLVLESMCKKDKPFIAVDCNAGAGLYYLDDERALKTGEALNGVFKLLDSSSEFKADDCTLPISIEKYILFLRPYMEQNRYPGSPEIIKKFLRDQDRAIFMELHNNEIEVLKSHIKDKRIGVHHRNCFEGLQALTPPDIRRGFVFMDPSYEIDEDYKNAAQSLCKVMKKWNTAVLCLWYPLLKKKKAKQEIMNDEICSKAGEYGMDYFSCELLVDLPCKESGLYGSGMLFVNPPWKLKENLQDAVFYLERVLKN